MTTARSSSERGKRGRRFVGGVARTILATMRGEDAATDAATQLLEGVSGAENVTNQLIRNLGRVYDLSLGRSTNWGYMHVLKDPEGQAAGLLAIYWERTLFEDLFLQRHLLAAQRQLPGLVLYAPPRDSEGHAFPADFPWQRELSGFVDNLRLRQAVTSERRRLGRATWLVTGVTPAELAAHDLVALCPEAPLRREFTSAQRWLTGFILAAVLVSLFLGMLLSRHFLQPLAELGQGVEAIARRSFGHRVPASAPDELGELARTFNRVMEGLSDLEVARIVQESLVPQAAVDLGPYRVAGLSRAASELGGDYFDLVKLPDGRLLILIADATGHGVAAALVMAMVKGLVHREVETGEGRPEVILSAVNRVVLHTLRTRRLMSCFAAVLDPAAHRMDIANAGHCFPLLMSPTAAPRFLEVRGLPLGASERRSYRGERIDLQPGDRVVFYTDGLIEAHAGREQIGYDRMVAAAATLPGCDPLGDCQALLDWLLGLTGPGPQEDDITVLVLHREPGDRRIPPEAPPA